MKTHDFKDEDFKTSSMCVWPDVTCVAVAMNKDIIAVRSTKDKGKTTVVFDHAEWTDFINAVMRGEFSTQQIE